MPKLKNLTCIVKWQGTGDYLPEFHTTYADGRVDCYLAIPENPAPFTIQLKSNDYIAPGLAMFVFIDGIYQCNRNRRDLQIPEENIPRDRTEIDFEVRQKEEFRPDGTIWGKQWHFRKVNAPDEASRDDHVEAPHEGEFVGTIEVTVLRCARNYNAPSPRSIYRLPAGFWENATASTAAFSSQHRWIGGLDGSSEECDFHGRAKHSKRRDDDWVTCTRDSIPPTDQSSSGISTDVNSSERQYIPPSSAASTDEFVDETSQDLLSELKAIEWSGTTSLNIHQNHITIQEFDYPIGDQASPATSKSNYDNENISLSAPVTPITCLGGSDGAGSDQFPSAVAGAFPVGIGTAALSSINNAFEHHTADRLTPRASCILLGDTDAKEYWSSWKSEKAKYPIARALNASYPLKKDEPWTVPHQAVEKNMTTHQVLPEKAMPYVHNLGRPRYMDTFERPYAVFSFKYRDIEVVEKLLGIQIKKVGKTTRESLAKLSKEQLIERLVSSEQYIHHPFPQQPDTGPPQWTQLQEPASATSLGKFDHDIHPETSHSHADQAQNNEHISWSDKDPAQPDNNDQVGANDTWQQANDSNEPGPDAWKESFHQTTGKAWQNLDNTNNNGTSWQDSFKDIHANVTDPDYNLNIQSTTVPQWNDSSGSRWTGNNDLKTDQHGDEPTLGHQSNCEKHNISSVWTGAGAPDVNNLASSRNDHDNDNSTAQDSFETAHTHFEYKEAPSTLRPVIDVGKVDFSECFPSQRAKVQDRPTEAWQSTFTTNQGKRTCNPRNSNAGVGSPNMWPSQRKETDQNTHREGAKSLDTWPSQQISNNQGSQRDLQSVPRNTSHMGTSNSPLRAPVFSERIRPTFGNRVPGCARHSGTPPNLRVETSHLEFARAQRNSPPQSAKSFHGCPSGANFARTTSRDAGGALNHQHHGSDATIMGSRYYGKPFNQSNLQGGGEDTRASKRSSSAQQAQSPFNKEQGDLGFRGQNDIPSGTGWAEAGSSGGNWSGHGADAKDSNVSW